MVSQRKNNQMISCRNLLSSLRIKSKNFSKNEIDDISSTTNKTHSRRTGRRNWIHGTNHQEEPNRRHTKLSSKRLTKSELEYMNYPASDDEFSGDFGF